MGTVLASQVKSYQKFLDEFEPLEGKVYILTHECTGAIFCECHIKGSKIVALGTTDVPLDPEDQLDYRANREVVVNHPAYRRMKEDAKKGRAFSNIVAEYTKEYDAAHPLKIIGGQHRFEAIKEAVSAGKDVPHGVKVYLDLNNEQRLDVQLISNTNIAVEGDLFDRMHETVQGPQLREWCQKTGLLKKTVDFADHRERGGPISVRLARAFVTNYIKGKSIDARAFDKSDTTPVLNPSGEHDADWEQLKVSNPNLWDDPKLLKAGEEFAKIIQAQRAALPGGKGRSSKPDMPEKAVNAAVLTAWAFVAGILSGNETRLKRHYALAATAGRDPLNAAELAKGRHKTDAENYRGLGYRTDPRERGRFVELFFLQTEKGDGITRGNIDIAIKAHHAKMAQLDVIRARGNHTDG